MSRRPALSGLADVARQSWREEAACGGAREDFVDVAGIEAAEYLIHAYCHRCPVLSDCNAWADTLRPEKWLSVYGGRVHGIGTAKQRRAS